MRIITSGIFLVAASVAVLLFNRSQVAIGNGEPNNLFIVGLGSTAMLIGIGIVMYGVRQKASTFRKR